MLMTNEINVLAADTADYRVSQIAEMIAAACECPSVSAVESEYHTDWDQLSILVRVSKVGGARDLEALESALFFRIKACLDAASCTFSWGLGIFQESRPDSRHGQASRNAVAQPAGIRVDRRAGTSLQPASGRLKVSA
jgi:hypothetical protein